MLRPETSFRTIARLTLLPVAAFALFVLWWHIRQPEQPASNLLLLGPEHAPRVARAADAAEQESGKSSATARGTIALIIDDLGFEGQQLERAMAIDPNISFAILPNGNRAADFARRLNERGFEVLCHLPMEPVGSESPGANAILTSMSDAEIARLVRTNVEAVPHARGVNNHMGSRATANRRVMESVIQALPKGLFFVDSRTGGKSVAETVAREKNVRTASRHVFLDDIHDPKEIRRQLGSLANIAARQGTAIGIGHPHAATLAVLETEVPRLRAEGYRLVRVSQVVN